MGHRSVTTEQAGEQMPMPVCWRTQRDTTEVLPEAHGRSSKQREPPPKTCTEKSYGAREKNRERSVRIRSDSTSSSLRARSPLPPCLPPFIGQEGSRSGINFLPTESTYLGSSMYLILSYIQHRACVREEPVPTLWCTDCACGRFSSRQRRIRQIV